MECRRARGGWLLGILATLASSGAPATAEPRILFVGDSITAGQRATDPARGGFAGQIGQRFPELSVANAGCGASSLRDWTNDEPETLCAVGNAWSLKAVPALPAQITHVLLGTNDATGVFEFFGPTPAWEYELRLRFLIERAPGLVLVSTPPRNRDNPANAVDARLRAYREAILRIVAELPRAELGVDAYALLDPQTDFADTLHPNDRGHTRLADALERRLLALLPRGALSPCRNERACSRFTFLPRYRRAPGPPGAGDRAPGRLRIGF